MKKIIISAALIFTTGIIASQSTVKSAHTTALVTIQRNVLSDRKDLASGD